MSRSAIAVEVSEFVLGGVGDSCPVGVTIASEWRGVWGRSVSILREVLKVL